MDIKLSENDIQIIKNYKDRGIIKWSPFSSMPEYIELIKKIIIDLK